MLIKMSVSISISYIIYIYYIIYIHDCKNVQMYDYVYNGCIKSINCIKLLAMARTGVSDWAAGR